MQPTFGPILSILCGGLLFLIFGGIGAFLLYRAYKTRQQADASQGWPSVQGQVVDTHVDHSARSDADGDMVDSYNPMVNFTYQVGGNTYHGDKVSYSPQRSFDSEAKAQAALQRYPVGGSVTVYYNPANPSESVLEKSAGGFAVSLVIGIVFILIALCTVCISLAAGLFAITGQTITY